MNFNDYIGYPLSYVTKEFDKLSIKYQIVESSDIQKNYDEILAVKFEQKDDFVKIITDKYLFNI